MDLGFLNDTEDMFADPRDDPNPAMFKEHMQLPEDESEPFLPADQTLLPHQAIRSPDSDKIKRELKSFELMERDLQKTQQPQSSDSLKGETSLLEELRQKDKDTAVTLSARFQVNLGSRPTSADSKQTQLAKDGGKGMNKKSQLPQHSDSRKTHEVNKLKEVKSGVPWLSSLVNVQEFATSKDLNKVLNTNSAMSRSKDSVKIMVVDKNVPGSNNFHNNQEIKTFSQPRDSLKIQNANKIVPELIGSKNTQEGSVQTPRLQTANEPRQRSQKMSQPIKSDVKQMVISKVHSQVTIKQHEIGKYSPQSIKSDLIPAANSNVQPKDRDKMQDEQQESQLINWKAIELRFQMRMEFLQAACKKYANSSLFRMEPTRFYPFPLYKPIMNKRVHYCPIPKTASTTWNEYLTSVKEYMKARDIQPSNANVMADEDIYFTFVRDPFSRLWSAYVDKLFTPNESFWFFAGNYILRFFRPSDRWETRPCAHDVTFPEFVKYVIRSQRTGEFRNAHFIPIHDQCDMCRYPYRYLGHLETFKEDMPYIIKAAGFPFNYTDRYDSQTIVQNAKMVLWKDRRAKVQACMNLDEASRRLWKKYQIRGLISKDVAFPYPPGGAVNISWEEFTARALEAYQKSKENPRRKEQREESLMEAYSLVPNDDLFELQRIFFLDFKLFGFRSQPSTVFPLSPFKQGNFSYFNLH